MAGNMQRFTVILTIIVLSALPATAAQAGTPVTLPVEVVGENGTTSSVTVEIPTPLARQVRSLWIEIHGLSYAGMVSVEINEGNWVSLNNDTVSVAEPGKSYGGIGGGFPTLKVTLPLQEGAVVGGTNIIRFRFNRTDGLASGFRVLAFNFLTSDSIKVLKPDAFKEEDPNTWTPPFRDSASLLAGRQFWQSATLTASGLEDASRIRAHCSDCHAYDGRDLKYFGYSNASIVARSRFHGLSTLQGQQIASYIRSLPVPSPGRPWNPPYQPGPGLDAQPVANWAAGAGLSWVLDSDTATLPFVFRPKGDLARQPDIGNAPESAIVAAITPDVFRPDGNLNPREIPISLQLPDWNHWLPRVHPLDAWGPAFENSESTRNSHFLTTAGLEPLAAASASSGRLGPGFRK